MEDILLFHQLLRTQHGLETLRPLIDKKDDLANTLSDVWNLLLDLRHMTLINLLKSPNLNSNGCLVDVKTILEKQMGKNQVK